MVLADRELTRWRKCYFSQPFCLLKTIRGMKYKLYRPLW